MNNLVLQPDTRRQLDSFIAAPSHAVILHGPAGSGKTAVATELAAGLLNIASDDVMAYPYLQVIDMIDGKGVSIEQVRTLEHFVSLRVPRPGEVNRIIIIANAQTLSLEAQNALLKTLEEPPLATVLILITASEQVLLPTIRSRAQAIAVKRPIRQDLVAHFTASGNTEAAISQAYAISGGLPGLMDALLGEKEHPLQPATVTARQLLQLSTYERLLLVDDLAKRKAHAIDALFILQQMAHARLQSSEGSQFKRWQQILGASYEASEQLASSAQPKLVLDRLMLNLG